MSHRIGDVGKVPFTGSERKAETELSCSGSDPSVLPHPRLKRSASAAAPAARRRRGANPAACTATRTVHSRTTTKRGSASGSTSPAVRLARRRRTRRSTARRRPRLALPSLRLGPRTLSMTRAWTPCSPRSPRTVSTRRKSRPLTRRRGRAARARRWPRTWNGVGCRLRNWLISAPISTARRRRRTGSTTGARGWHGRLPSSMRSSRAGVARLVISTNARRSSPTARAMSASVRFRCARARSGVQPRGWARDARARPRTARGGGRSIRARQDGARGEARTHQRRRGRGVQRRDGCGIRTRGEA